MMLFLKNLVFTIIVPGTVSVFIPLFVFSNQEPNLISLTGAIGFVLLVSGSGIYLWCVWDFARTGRGTPAPVDPPKTLVVRGLYKYCRNPMYLGVLSIVFGWVFLFRSGSLAVYGAGAAFCFHLVVVFFEEVHLREVFGQSYEEYCARVNRWVPLGNKSRVA